MPGARPSIEHVLDILKHLCSLLDVDPIILDWFLAQSEKPAQGHTACAEPAEWMAKQALLAGFSSLGMLSQGLPEFCITSCSVEHLRPGACVLPPARLALALP